MYQVLLIDSIAMSEEKKVRLDYPTTYETFEEACHTAQIFIEQDYVVAIRKI